jgi:hypothetical protein
VQPAQRRNILPHAAYRAIVADVQRGFDLTLDLHGWGKIGVVEMQRRLALVKRPGIVQRGR